MEYILRETIETINGPFTIGKIGESVFWQVDSPSQSKSLLFDSLGAAQRYIRDTEHSDNWENWEELFEEYVEENQAVK